MSPSQSLSATSLGGSKFLPRIRRKSIRRHDPTACATGKCCIFICHEPLSLELLTAGILMVAGVSLLPSS